MAEQSALHIIARIHSDFPTKFGIPRQSGLVEELKATIVFEPEYRNPDALRGLEGFSHLWLIWQFSQAVRKDCRPRCARLVWGQYPHGGLCHPLSLPSQSHRG